MTVPGRDDSVSRSEHHGHGHGGEQAGGEAHNHDDSQDHGHDHEHGVASSAAKDAATHVRSIGVDIGSATTHFAVSELLIGLPEVLGATKPVVLDRQVVYYSPIILTPYSDPDHIDVAALERFITEEAESTGLNLKDIDTGAVICTGEAARKENARAISDRMSTLSGEFVCAIAGHHLEAVLGAYGSGAVEDSRQRSNPIVVLDIGGGTAKRSLVVGSRVLNTAAMNVGARLVATSSDEKVVRLEQAAQKIAGDAGVALELGIRLSVGDQQRIVARMVDCLLAFVEMGPADELSDSLLLTGKPELLPDDFELSITGGVSEFFYERSSVVPGDLGPALAAELRHRLLRDESSHTLLDLGGGIRSTVVGAAQFSVQASGSTIFASGGLELPLRGLPVREVAVHWTALSPASLANSIREAFTGLDTETICALLFPRLPAFGYRMARQLASMLGEVLGKVLPQGAVLVFTDNLARTVGEELAKAPNAPPFLAVDELELGEMDYLDIGGSVRGSDFLPVVVKSLVFG